MPAGSRAVLIGVADFEDDRFPPIPAAANSIEGVRRMLTRPDLCGWGDEEVTVRHNPVNAGRIARELRELMRQTTGVLVFYYVGHGQLTADGRLCLAVADTLADAPEYLGLGYDWVAAALRDSPAQVKVTILDCCFSGQAIEALGDAAGQVADLSHVAGVYTLTATIRNQPAHVAPAAQQATALTSFTGQLVELVEEGIPGGPMGLTLGDLYRALQPRLAARGLPRPNHRGTHNAHDFVFTRNVAATRRGADAVADADGVTPVTPAKAVKAASAAGGEPTAVDAADHSTHDRPAPRWRLPPRLAARFRVERVGADDTGPTVLDVVEHAAPERRRTLRLHPPGVVLDPDRVDRALALGQDPESRRHLAPLYEVGSEEGAAFEVRERWALSLRSVMTGGSPVDPMAVAREVGQALAFLEGRFVLGGLTADSLLVRGLQPLDLVVGDLALDGGVTSGRGHQRLSPEQLAHLPPEANRNLVTPAWDWWSAGVIIAEVALGRHPLADRDGRLPPRHEIFDRVRYGDMVGGIQDARLRSLCRGLLRRDHAQRWRRDKVLAWIVGA